MAVLQAAETQAGSLSSGLRVYSLVRIADGYARVDKAMGVQTLESTHRITAGMKDDPALRESMQAAILQRLFRLSPDLAAELWEGGAPPVRNRTADLMLKYRLDKKDLTGAADIVFKISSDDVFPFAVAARVLDRLPEEMVVEREQIFMAALHYTRRHPEEGRAQFEDFGTLLLRSWRRIPPKLVLESIELLLDQARRVPSERLIVSDARKSTLFGSTYEYRVFQVLPILRQLDRDRANLLARYPAVARAEKANPNGILPALGANVPQGAGSPTHPTLMTYAIASAEEAINEETEEDVRRQLDHILEIAATNPRESVRRAASFQEVTHRRPLGFIPRMEALTAITGIVPTSEREVLAMAVDGIYKNLARVPLEAQDRYLEIAIKQAARINDESRMAAGIQRGLKIAETLYLTDADREDPNQEMKAFWPSAAIWQKYIFLEMKYLPRAVPDDLEGIRDEEIRGLARIATALASLGERELRVTARVKKKHRSRTPECSALTAYLATLIPARISSTTATARCSSASVL